VSPSPWCLDEHFDEGEGAAGAFGVVSSGGRVVVRLFHQGMVGWRGDAEGQVRAVTGLDQREAFLAESGSTRT
jgi:hypothetical protein